MLSPPAEISISTPLRGILRIPGRDQAPERGHKNQLKLRVLARLAPLAVPPHGRQKAEPAKHFVKQAIIKEAIWCTEEDIMPSMLHAPKTLHSNCGVFNPHNVQLEGPSAREQRSCLPVIGIAPPCLCGGLCFPANTISPGNQTLHRPEDMAVGELRVTDRPPKTQTVGILLLLPWCAPARSCPCRIRPKTEILTSSMLRSFSSRVDTCRSWIPHHVAT